MTEKQLITLETAQEYLPFYTLQKHPETRKRQMELWTELVLNYCKEHKMRFLDVLEAEDLPLFKNDDIGRRLYRDEIRQVMEYMVTIKKAEKSNDTRYNIFAESIESMADALYSWIDSRGETGVVLTVYEVINNEAASNQPFYHMELELFRKLIDSLEKRKLVVTMKTGLRLKDSDGLKFK